jgi:hypothetical protein
MINGGMILNSETMKEYKRRGSRVGIDVPEPHRVMLHTPADEINPLNPLPHPYDARTNAIRVLWAKASQPDWYFIVCVDSNLTRIEMWFAGFHDSAAYAFKRLDKMSNTWKESFTITKRTAMQIKANGLKGIPWKES